MAEERVFSRQLFPCIRSLSEWEQFRPLGRIRCSVHMALSAISSSPRLLAGGPTCFFITRALALALVASGMPVWGAYLLVNLNNRHPICLHACPFILFHIPFRRAWKLITYFRFLGAWFNWSLKRNIANPTYIIDPKTISSCSQDVCWMACLLFVSHISPAQCCDSSL